MKYPTILFLLLPASIGLSVGCGKNTDSKTSLQDKKAYQDSIHAVGNAKNDSIRRANLTEWETLNHDSLFNTIPKHIIAVDSNLSTWRSFLLNSTYVDSILFKSMSEYTSEFEIYLMDMDDNGEPEFSIDRDIYTIVDSVITKLEYDHDGMTPFNNPIKLGNQTFIASGVGYGGRAGSSSYSIYSTYKKGLGFRSFGIPAENYNNHYYSEDWPSLFFNEWDSIRKISIKANTISSIHDYEVNMNKYWYYAYSNRNTDGIDIYDFETVNLYKGKIIINYTWKDTGLYITSKTDHPGFIDVVDGEIIYRGSILNPKYYTGDLKTCIQLEQYFKEHNLNLEEITQYLDEYYN